MLTLANPGAPLRHHGAPKTIDYLSIDTEGSELEILSAFDFSAYHVRIITVEHNYSPMRGKLHDLLTSNSFTRAFERIFRLGRLVSQARFITCCPGRPFQIETNCGSGSDNNARVPYPSECLKSPVSPRGFENWT